MVVVAVVVVVVAAVVVLVVLVVVVVVVATPFCANLRGADDDAVSRKVDPHRKGGCG